MKAQVVKNAVIVPTGAKGGFYPKHLPPSSERDAWLAEGTESYRIFIRALLSVTDNIVGGKVVHPDGLIIRDGEGPLFRGRRPTRALRPSPISPTRLRCRANSGSATLSPAAAATATTTRAMGITAKGAWISVQRHFREMGVDVQSDPVRVIGVGDMSGDVFGKRHAAVQVAEAGGGVRPPPHLRRSRSRSGEELGGARAHVRAAAVELGRL